MLRSCARLPSNWENFFNRHNALGLLRQKTSIRFNQAVLSNHIRSCLSKTFDIMISFRMIAVIAICAGFPTSLKVVHFCFKSGLKRRATTAGMYMAHRNILRPPFMYALPFHVSDCLVSGAKPARDAASFEARLPSSGISINIVIAVIAPIPGMLLRI